MHGETRSDVMEKENDRKIRVSLKYACRDEQLVPFLYEGKHLYTYIHLLLHNTSLTKTVSALLIYPLNVDAYAQILEFRWNPACQLPPVARDPSSHT